MEKSILGTHEHIDIDNIVQDIFNYENEEGNKIIKDFFTENEVKDKLLREISKKENDMTIEEIIENVKEEMNQDAKYFARERKL